MRKQRKKHLYDSIEPVAKERFLERHLKKIFNYGC